MKSPLRDLALLGWNLTGDLGDLTFYTTEKGKVVAFPRAPPLNPPSDAQEANRDRFRRVADWWAACPQDYRALCRRMCRRASLRISGYALITHVALCCDYECWHTLTHQTGIYPNPPPDLRT